MDMYWCGQKSGGIEVAELPACVDTAEILHTGDLLVAYAPCPSGEGDAEYFLLCEDGTACSDYSLATEPFFTLVIRDGDGLCRLPDVAREEDIARRWLTAFAEGAVSSATAAEVAEEILSVGW